MKISLTLLENNADISNKILKALLPEVTKYMDSSINAVKLELPGIIRQSLINSPEYNSIISGELRYEFGIPDPGAKLAGLLDIWSSNIQYSYIKPTINNNQITYKNIIMEYGTRLDIIAEKEYGDSTYWWVIAAASKIGWGLQVPEGVVLTIPNLGQVLTLVYG